jgi:hypothetical protein
MVGIERFPPISRPDKWITFCYNTNEFKMESFNFQFLLQSLEILSDDDLVKQISICLEK